MIKELSVRLNGVQIGMLKLVRGKMEFSYDESAKIPISLSLPLQDAPFKEKVCRSFFGGLLPENANMREKLAEKYKININDDFKLLQSIGGDCAGAVSFCEPNDPQIEEDYVKLAGKFFSDEELRQKIQELPYRPYMGNRISLAGAQEKTAICMIDENFVEPNNNVPTTHILKTALPAYTESIQNEYICMKTAAELGLDVANVEIRKVDNLEVLLIERFDREFKDGKLKRILQEDFAQSLGVQSRDKYKISFKDCLWVLERTKVPIDAKIKFVKQVVYNYLIGNTDAHGKNFSLFLSGEKANTLTPAYDLLCSSVYDCDKKLAMKIGKANYYKDVTETDWKLFANDIDISPNFVFSELEKQKSTLPNAMKKIVDELNCEIGFKIFDYIKSFCDK